MPSPHAEIWAAVALLPLLFYASALSRGKAAPKLRSPYAPFALLAFSALAVFFSGGLHSPLFGAYALLTLAVAALSGAKPAALLAALISALEFGLSKREPEAPSLAPLILPWSGLVFGRLLS